MDNFLVEGRKGVAENLFKKINYNNYRGKLDPKTALYNGIQTKGNLVEIFLTQKNIQNILSLERLMMVERPIGKEKSL